MGVEVPMNKDCKYGKSDNNVDAGMKSILFRVIVVAYLVTTYGMAVHSRVPMLVPVPGTVSALSHGQNSEGSAQTRWLPKRHLPLTKQPAIFLRTISFLGHPSRDTDSPRRDVHASNAGPYTVPDRTPGPNRAPPTA
jgi:hypothetical protein